jgi:hypothetical protein
MSGPSFSLTGGQSQSSDAAAASSAANNVGGWRHEVVLRSDDFSNELI